MLLIDKKFPPRKGIFCLFLVFLFLSPFAFFGLPLFQFLFLCLSVVLFFLPSFLSFFFAFFLFLVFVYFFPFLSSLLLFHEKNNIKIFNCNVFFPEIVSLSFGFLSCFLFEIPFSYLCFFLILSYVFCSTSMFLVSKHQIEKHTFLVKKGGCNKTVFFYEPVFCKM